MFERKVQEVSIMNQYVEYWNIGAHGGIGYTVDKINSYSERHHAEIVSITYAEGNILVVFKEKENGKAD